MKASPGTAVSARRVVLWRRLVKKNDFARLARVFGFAAGKILFGRVCSAIPDHFVAIVNVDDGFQTRGHGRTTKKTTPSIENDESNEM